MGTKCTVLCPGAQYTVLNPRAQYELSSELSVLSSVPDPSMVPKYTLFNLKHTNLFGISFDPLNKLENPRSLSLKVTRLRQY